MTRRNGPKGQDTANERDLLEAYFDGELDSAGKGRLHEALRHDAVLAEEFSRTSEAVSMLRQSTSNTGLKADLTDSVMARCEVRDRLLSKHGRRFVLAGRSAVALATLMIVAGLVVWVRMTPPQLRLAESERPLSVLLESGDADAGQLRLVPSGVQKDLADSVDQSKSHGTIVFHLEADAATSFSSFGVAPDDAASAPQRTAMAQLPLLARPNNIDAQRAAAARLGPMPMAGQHAASMVRGDLPQSHGWWGRSSTPRLTLPGFSIIEHEGLLLVHPEPTIADDRARE